MNLFDNRREQLENGFTVVANWKLDKELIAWAKSRDLYVYIGRENYHAKEKCSPWHNPFKGGPNKEMLDKYLDYLVSNESLMERITELRGKLLVCWCYPKACHGDLLALLANGG